MGASARALAAVHDEELRAWLIAIREGCKTGLATTHDFSLNRTPTYFWSLTRYIDGTPGHQDRTLLSYTAALMIQLYVGHPSTSIVESIILQELISIQVHGLLGSRRLAPPCVFPPLYIQCDCIVLYMYVCTVLIQ